MPMLNRGNRSVFSLFFVFVFVFIFFLLVFLLFFSLSLFPCACCIQSTGVTIDAERLILGRGFALSPIYIYRKRFNRQLSVPNPLAAPKDRERRRSITERRFSVQSTVSSSSLPLSLNSARGEERRASSRALRHPTASPGQSRRSDCVAMDISLFF